MKPPADDSSRPPSRRALRERTILQTTLEELARSDYGSLSIEQVAARAGVNKTTIYRRWPTKLDLVQAAIRSMAEAMDPGISSGSLRIDLFRVGRQILRLTSSLEGQSMIRLRLAGHPELKGIVQEIQSRRQEQYLHLIREAVRRGEVSGKIDPALVLEMLSGTLFGRIVLRNEPVDETYIGRVIDVILAWAAPQATGTSSDPRPAQPSSGRRRAPRASKRGPRRDRR